LSIKISQSHPDILNSIKDSGIEKMEIYRTIKRHFRIMKQTMIPVYKKTLVLCRIQKVQVWKQLLREISSGLTLYKTMEKAGINEKYS
jgi:hypothetical protein